MAGDRSNAMTLGALGLISGALSWASILVPKLIGLYFEAGLWGVFWFSPFSLFPGLIFGLIFGFLLHRRHKIEGRRQVGYVVAAGLAYYCAFHVAMQLVVHHVSDLIAGGISAGLIGSLLLGIVTIRLLRLPGRVVLPGSVGVGTAAGALLWLTFHDRTQWGWDYLAFFVLWQGAYAASLAPILRPALVPPWEGGFRAASQSPPAPGSE